MDIVIADIIDCTSAELRQEVAKYDERDVLAHLSAKFAELERENTDGSLYNRIAASYLVTAFVEGASVPPNQEHQRPPMDRLFRMANGLAVRDGQIDLSRSELHEHNNRMMLRLTLRHQTYMGPLKPALGRAEILLSRIMPGVLAGRANPLDYLGTAVGASYAELRDLFLGLFAHTNAGPGAALITRNTFSITHIPDRGWELANRFAGTRSELYELMNSHKGYAYKTEWDFRYAFSVLRNRPLVRLSSGELIAPISRHLALAFSEGIFDFIQQYLDALGDPAASSFDDVFGDVTDEYVRERFKRDMGTGSYLPLPEVKGALSPDGVSADGECLFELKGKRLLRGTATTGDINAARRYIGGKRGLGRGAAQLLSEIARTRQGRGRGLAADRVDEVVPCLVTPDGLPGFHLAPVRKWIIRAFEDVVRIEFPQVASEISALERLEWLSFDELDRLVRASRISGASIGRLLRRFRLESPARPLDAQKGTLPPTLAAWLYDRYPASNDDPWVDEAFSSVFDECNKRFFGGSD